jgi:hypothetical protein
MQHTGSRKIKPYKILAGKYERRRPLRRFRHGRELVTVRMWAEFLSFKIHENGGLM